VRYLYKSEGYSIPQRLLFIPLSGYTEEEKEKIAFQFLIPHQKEENLSDIPDYIKKDMKLVLVEHFQEVFDLLSF
jgi:ATP-dependent Lon protease